MWERMFRKEENDMTMTSRSHVSDKSKGFKIGAVAEVGDKSRAPKSWREPLLYKVGALNRGHCWSCSNEYQDVIMSTN
jgi:hypothetical protein